MGSSASDPWTPEAIAKDLVSVKFEETTANTFTILTAANAKSKTPRIVGWQFFSEGAQSLRIEDTDGTDLTGTVTLAANGLWEAPVGPVPVKLKGTSGKGIQIVKTGANGTRGFISYVLR